MMAIMHGRSISVYSKSDRTIKLRFQGPHKCCPPCRVKPNTPPKKNNTRRLKTGSHNLIQSINRATFKPECASRSPTRFTKTCCRSKLNNGWSKNEKKSAPPCRMPACLCRASHPGYVPPMICINTYLNWTRITKRRWQDYWRSSSNASRLHGSRLLAERTILHRLR